MLYSEDIKKAYKSLARIDRKLVKESICERFGYKERNFQAKMAGLIPWTKVERSVLSNLLELEGA